MNRVCLLLAGLLLFCSMCGCMTPTPTRTRVPTWIGLPAAVIEPTSLEGMAWYSQMRARHEAKRAERAARK